MRVRSAAFTGEKITGTEWRIADLWANSGDYQRLADIGRGKGVIFSPDISVHGNRKFYESLGFAYFEDPAWEKVIAEVHSFNRLNPDRAIKILLVQTHGTNGNGLKLQTSTKKDAPRSYISIGALQQMLEGSGVKLCIVAACNAGRLFRPHIYNRLDEKAGGPLFLPPTLGLTNASTDYDAAASTITVARRTDNSMEMTHNDDARMFSMVTRARFVPGAETSDRRASTVRFVVSYLLVQLILHDPTLDLTATGYEEKESRRELSSKKRVELLEQFFDYVERIAARE